MSDRLEELRRQRALVQEHLAWMDREIAALDGGARTPTPAPVAAARAVTSIQSPAPIARVAPPAAVPHFPEYEPNAATMQNDAKRGCLIYAAIGLVVFFAILVGIYFVAYRDHPLFRAEKPPATAPRK